MLPWTFHPGLAHARQPSAGGTIVFARAADEKGDLDRRRLWATTPTGGFARRLTLDFSSAAARLGELDTLDPAIRPHGSSLVFTAITRSQLSSAGLSYIFTAPLAGGAASEILKTGGELSPWATWSPDGEQLLYNRAGPGFGGLRIRDLDARRSTPLPPARSRASQASWSRGRIAFVRPYGAEDRDGRFYRMTGDIYLTSPTGHRARLLVGGKNNEWPRLSPDGRWIVFSKRRAHRTVLERVKATGGKPHQLTHGTHDVTPSWSPDGREIVFARGHGGYYHAHHRIVVLDLATRRVRAIPNLPRGGNTEEPVWTSAR